MLIAAGESKDYEQIRNRLFGELVRGKILATYFPDRYLCIFSKEYLQYFLDYVGIGLSPDSDILDMQNSIVEWKN